jgi:GR25 family glycosyltransferase involved in LPS biosynthesis
MFDSVIAITFYIIFCVEMHANDVFLFFKNNFWYQHIKTIQKVQTVHNFSKKKKKKLKFAEKQVEQQSQTLSKSHQQTLLLFPSGFRENQLLKVSFSIF